MTDYSSNSSNVGNTNISTLEPVKKQISPSLHWCFTLNNWTDDDKDEILAVCSNSSKKYVFQSEIGENGGTPHLQGYIEFNSKVRPMNLFKNKKIHWEKTKWVNASIKYCSKDSTYTGQRWTNIRMEKPLKIINDLKDWQSGIIDLISNEPDDRSIYWYWDENGGVGKSVFCKYLVVKHNALVISGKSTDVKYGIVKYKEKHGVYPELIILDVPRSNLAYINYEAIENVKNGLFFSTKYESEMVIFNSPHLIVFANEEPDYDKMSSDRWHVINII